MADLTPMRRGDDRTVTFTFAGDSVFEPGDVVRFTLKRRSNDMDVAALVSAVSPGGVTVAGATATAEIPRAATDSLDRTTRLRYDWQLTTAAGKTRTIDSGTIIVLPDSTRTP